MTKRINQPSTVVVPATVAHAPEGATPASAKVAAAVAVAEAAAKAEAAKEEAAANEAVIAAAAPAPIAMIDAAVAAQDTATTGTTTTTTTTVTDEETADDATPYIVGGVLLAGGVLAIALSGGDDDDAPAPVPAPTPTPTNTVTISTAAAATVAENVAAGATGAVVLDVNATANGGAPTFALSGADAALFTINSTTGEIRFVNSPNFEATPARTTFNVTVTASSAASGTTPAATATQNVVITLTNVNEAPAFANPTATVSVPENTSIATAIITGGAVDPDANSTVTYTLAGADAALFAVNAQTGAVTFRASPDFEATPTRTSFTFNLVATDNATPALASSQAVTVNITDVAEGVVLAGTQSLSAAGANIQYIESAGTPNTSTITSFGIGDTITVDVPTSSYSFSNNGADLLITFANNGVVNSITLVGAVNANAVVTTEATAEQAVGSNFFLAGASVPPPAAAANTIDGTGSQPTYNAANTAATFTENAGVPNTTTISNFGSDDRIVVQGAAAGSYSFTNTATDIIITFPNAGVVNQITLTGVVSNPLAVVTTEAEAEQLLGFDFFRYA